MNVEYNDELSKALWAPPEPAQQGASDSNAVLGAVVAERARQDGKYGGAQTDDARKTPEDWCNDIEAYVVWARQMHRMGSPDKYRRRMMQIAALAVAACESFDRKAANIEVKAAP